MANLYLVGTAKIFLDSLFQQLVIYAVYYVLLLVPLSKTYYRYITGPMVFNHWTLVPHWPVVLGHLRDVFLVGC